MIPSASSAFLLNRTYMSTLIDMASKKPIALQCLLYLCNHMGHDNTLYCSYGVLAKVCNRSVSTIARAVRVLREQGFINIQNIKGIKTYCVNIDFARTIHISMKV
jgi:DNA-binding transcriptional regulator YhcF (GntR family)